MVGASHSLRMIRRAVEVLQPNDKVKEFMRDDFMSAIVICIEEAGTERDAFPGLV